MREGGEPCLGWCDARPGVGVHLQRAQPVLLNTRHSQGSTPSRPPRLATPLNRIRATPCHTP
jgi:hypothetical protein